MRRSIFIVALAVCEVVELEPIPDTPALLIKEQKSWVCVADLHLGIEVQLRASGFNIPSQTSKILSSLEALSSRGKNLIVLGDVKHRIPSVGYMENREILPFIKRLQEIFRDVVVVAGNHDGGLSSVLPEGLKAYSGHGTTIGTLGLVHGHVWPSGECMNSERLVMGHVHPSVLMVDSLGTRTNEKCWVRAKFMRKRVLERFGSCPKELVIVPAFNPLLTGTPVNVEGGTRLGPLLRNEMVDISSYRVYLLDGSNLGKPRVQKGRAYSKM